MTDDMAGISSWYEEDDEAQPALSSETQLPHSGFSAFQAAARRNPVAMGHAGSLQENIELSNFALSQAQVPPPTLVPADNTAFFNSTTGFSGSPLQPNSLVDNPFGSRPYADLSQPTNGYAQNNWSTAHVPNTHDPGNESNVVNPRFDFLLFAGGHVPPSYSRQSAQANGDFDNWLLRPQVLDHTMSENLIQGHGTAPAHDAELTPMQIGERLGMQMLNPDHTSLTFANPSMATFSLFHGTPLSSDPTLSVPTLVHQLDPSVASLPTGPSIAHEPAGPNYTTSVADAQETMGLGLIDELREFPQQQSADIPVIFEPLHPLNNIDLQPKQQPHAGRQDRSQETTHSAAPADLLLSQAPKRKASKQKASKRRLGPQERIQVAQRREEGSCIRCRMKKLKCWYDPEDPQKLCVNCAQSGDHFNLCFHYKTSRAFIYKQQECPQQHLSRRWQRMDLVEIDGWVPGDSKTIQISPTSLPAPLDLEVREFSPSEWDVQEVMERIDATSMSHPTPCYAIADVQKTALGIEAFLDSKVSNYIEGLSTETPGLVGETFSHAWSNAHQTQNTQHKDFLLSCFRYWVAVRMMTDPQHICGTEKLGGQIVNEPRSTFHDKVPAPPALAAQLECIVYTTIIVPTCKKIHDMLWKLAKDSKANKPQHWLTIFLAIFVLLHTCSIAIRRHEEAVKEHSSKETPAEVEAITKLKNGANFLLAIFHYLNRGLQPLKLIEINGKRPVLDKIALLNEDEISFLRRIRLLARKDQGYRDWIYQLFDKKWQPELPT